MAKKRSPYDKPKRYKEKKVSVPPPCPDPNLYVAVRKKDGSYYWRLKRGTNKPAVLNEVLTAVAKNKKVTMAAAERLVKALDPFTCNRHPDLKFGTYKHNHQHFAKLFTRSILANGKMDWSFFKGVDINPNCSFNKIVPGDDHKLSMNKNTATVKISLWDHVVEKLRWRTTTHFYFELILISGNPAKENSLRSESDRSEYYPYKNSSAVQKARPKYCELSLIVPEKKPYILILKAATAENQYKLGPNHEGLLVVGWG